VKSNDLAGDGASLRLFSKFQLWCNGSAITIKGAIDSISLCPGESEFSKANLLTVDTVRTQKQITPSTLPLRNRPLTLDLTGILPSLVELSHVGESWHQTAVLQSSILHM